MRWNHLQVKPGENKTGQNLHRAKNNPVYSIQQELHLVLTIKFAILRTTVHIFYTLSYFLDTKILLKKLSSKHKRAYKIWGNKNMQRCLKKATKDCYLYRWIGLISTFGFLNPNAWSSSWESDDIAGTCIHMLM